MSQSDQNIENQTFPSARTDINQNLAALFSLSSASTAPTTTVAGMLWYDTANGLIKQRNASDNGWVTKYAIAAQGLIDQNGSTVYGALGGTGNAWTLTLAPAVSAYVAGQTF